MSSGPAASNGMKREVAQAVLVTKRLFMRMPTRDDIPALSRLVSDPLIARYTSQIRYPYTPPDARRFVESCALDPAPHVAAHFLLIPRANPRLIAGGAGFGWEIGGLPEIGYWVSASYRGRGFASEAVQALLYRIFTGSTAEIVSAACYPDNAASLRVLERAGFRRSGRGMRHSLMFRRYMPVIEFILNRPQWAKRQPPSR
jgi:RimJ/RimL family protein N-acetyltransferase